MQYSVVGINPSNNANAIKFLEFSISHIVKVEYILDLLSFILFVELEDQKNSLQGQNSVLSTTMH
jgi:hypothetical protein